MSVYRSPPATPRCERCGLELLEHEGDEFARALLACIAGSSRTHGGRMYCPGPPLLELVPWWRALLELVVG